MYASIYTYLPILASLLMVKGGALPITLPSLCNVRHCLHSLANPCQSAYGEEGTGPPAPPPLSPHFLCTMYATVYTYLPTLASLLM